MNRDFQRAAAGDLDESNHSPSRSEIASRTSSEKQQDDLEYAQGVLEYLEAVTLQKVADPDQRGIWVARLSKVQRWRLMKLPEFSGRLADVWKFLDTLPVPISHASEFEPKGLPAPRTTVMHDLLEHERRMHASTPDTPFTLAEHERKWKVELEGLWDLNKKYPTHGFDWALKSRSQAIEEKRAWLFEQGR